LSSAPEYWQEYFTEQIASQSAGKGQAGTSGAAQVSTAGGTQDVNSGEKIFTAGNDVTEPKPRVIRQPEYTDAARARRLEGKVGLTVTVDSSGKLIHVAIVKPLGLGLDEAAIKAVHAWPFSPGMRNGQPVAVRAYLEVDFHLYQRL
jgi:TonB family protein